MSPDVRAKNPGRRTWAASSALLAAYVAAATATAAAVADGGTHRPEFALGLVSMAVFLVAIRTTVPVALAAGAMGWLFYAGFITGRHAQLAWQGMADIRRLGILLGVALCGVAASWIHARIAARRPVPAEPDPAEADLARRAHVVNLADARAARLASRRCDPCRPGTVASGTSPARQRRH